MAQSARRSVVDADVLYRPVRSGNAFEETVERLLQLIKLGVVAAGERLPPERELAVRLAVSRETLRDAIGSLREAGWVEARRGRNGGTFVLQRLASARPSTRRRPKSSDVEDVLTLRAVLEVGAAEQAASRRLSKAERLLLSEALESVTSSGHATYRLADSRLHLAIARVSGSPSLLAAVADARARVNDLLDAIPLLSRNITHSDEQHARLVTAILDGDPATARAEMQEHVAGSAALLRAFLA